MPWPKQVIKIKHLIGGFLTVSEGKSKIIIVRSMIICRHGRYWNNRWEHTSDQQFSGEREQETEPGMGF